MRTAYFAGDFWGIVEDGAHGECLAWLTNRQVEIRFPDDRTRLDVWLGMILINGVLYKANVKEGTYMWPYCDVLSEVVVPQFPSHLVDYRLLQNDYVVTLERDDMEDDVSIVDSRTIRVTKGLTKSTNPEISELRLYGNSIYRMPSSHVSSDHGYIDVNIPDVGGLEDTDYPIHVSEYSPEVLIIMQSGLAIVGELSAWCDDPKIVPRYSFNVDCSDFQGVLFAPRDDDSFMILNGGVATDYIFDNDNRMTSRVLIDKGFITCTEFESVYTTKRIKSAAEE